MEESKNATKRVDCDDYSATNRFVVVASSVQVLPERLLLVGANPQSPRSALCAYLRILKNAPKTIQESTYNVNTKISAQTKNVRKFLLTMRIVCV